MERERWWNFSISYLTHCYQHDFDGLENHHHLFVSVNNGENGWKLLIDWSNFHFCHKFATASPVISANEHERTHNEWSFVFPTKLSSDNNKSPWPCEATVWRNEKIFSDFCTSTSQPRYFGENVCLIQRLIQLHKPVGSNVSTLIQIICWGRIWGGKNYVCSILLILIASYIMDSTAWYWHSPGKATI